MRRSIWRVWLVCFLLVTLVACDLLEEDSETSVSDLPSISSDTHELDDIRVEDISVSTSGNAKIEIQDTDISFLFVAIAEDKDDQLYVTDIVAPDGTVIYELHNFDDDEFSSDMFTETMYGDGEVIVYLPVAPQFGELQVGEYEIKLDSVYGDGIKQASVVIRSGPVSEWQAVDINMFVVSENDDVADMDNWPDLEANVRTAVDSVLNQQQMRLGELNIVQASDTIINKYAQIDDEDQEKLCKLMADEVGLQRAWNIVLVDELLDEDNNPYYGLSPFPGSTLIVARDTCVIVAWDIHDNDFIELGGTIVHEASHFAALQHTTEEDGLMFDIFTDTPQCPLNRYDENEDDSIDDEECGEAGGASNYMFPTSADLQELIMTNDQGWVLRRHPTFYPVMSSSAGG